GAARSPAAGRWARHVLSRRPDRACGGDREWRRARDGERDPQLRRRRRDRDRAGGWRCAADGAVHRCSGADDRHRGRADRGGAARRNRVTIMWRATVLTIFPDMFPGPLGQSLAGKALASGLWSLDACDIRTHATDRHRTVDDTPAGGGPGMVMKADVLARALDALGDDGR